MKHKIVRVDYGLASAYSDGTIEINRKLKGKLRQKILAHELRHTPGIYSVKDFQNDFQAQEPHFFQALWFSIKNPECLIGYFPIMYSYHFKKLTFNSTSFFPVFMFGITFCLFWGFLLISLDFKFIGIIIVALVLWIELVTLVNIILLFYTDLYIRDLD